MKDINDVIREVIVRTGFPEEAVTDVIRSAAADCREFTEKKKGYNIYWPRLGTFCFRVTAIRDYIRYRRGYMAYWLYRLRIGEKTNNSRAITAGTINIKRYADQIEAVLKIKEEFLKDHSKYEKFKAKLLMDDTDSNIGRLVELLDVEALVPIYAEKYRRKAAGLPWVPPPKENPGDSPVQ
jgi:hypothetical protein